MSRRTALAGLGSIGLGALLAACGRGGGSTTTATASDGATVSVSPQATGTADLTGLFAGANTCTLAPSTTQGPYYFDADKVRSDIREDRQGSRLRLAIRVQDSESCRAVPDAVVEIWHCDAASHYSGAEALSTGGGGAPGGAPGRPDGNGGGGGGGSQADLVPQDDKRYLRGAQVTDTNGIVSFTTIWPGWYSGRTVHIHAMVHVNDERTLTTQLMMDEKLNSAVLAEQPYAAHTGRDTFNDGDGIYKPAMLLKITEDGGGHLGVITLAVDPDKNGR
ncbi:protocatechuate dioxygenase [Kitasatospora arboriphila]